MTEDWLQKSKSYYILFVNSVSYIQFQLASLSLIYVAGQNLVTNGQNSLGLSVKITAKLSIKGKVYSQIQVDKIFTFHEVSAIKL